MVESCRLRTLLVPPGRRSLVMSCLDGSRIASDDGSEWVGSSLVFGPLMQPLEGLLALMESASRVPICNAGSAAFDIRWGVPTPV